MALFVSGSPPSGEKVTSTPTFALPFWASFSRALPFNFTCSFTSPAASARLFEPFTFFVCESSTPPAPATVTVSFAVPLRLFFFALPRLSSFEVLTATVAVAAVEVAVPLVAW